MLRHLLVAFRRRAYTGELVGAQYAGVSRLFWEKNKKTKNRGQETHNPPSCRRSCTRTRHAFAIPCSRPFSSASHAKSVQLTLSSRVLIHRERSALRGFPTLSSRSPSLTQQPSWRSC